MTATCHTLTPEGLAASERAVLAPDGSSGLQSKERAAAAVNALCAVLRLVTALASRVARLLRCPSWAVRLTFALEAKRLRAGSRSKS